MLLSCVYKQIFYLAWDSVIISLLYDEEVRMESHFLFA